MIARSIQADDGTFFGPDDPETDTATGVLRTENGTFLPAERISLSMLTDSDGVEAASISLIGFDHPVGLHSVLTPITLRALADGAIKLATKIEQRADAEATAAIARAKAR